MSKVAKNYVSLHVHSDYSRLDSIAKIKDLVAKAKGLEMKSVALTDHGTISGWIKFHEECSKNDIKPLFGIEAYIVDDALSIKDIDGTIESMQDKKKTYMPLFDGIIDDPESKISELKDKRVKERKSNHLILLAKNEVGFKNIIKLSSWAYIHGMYYKPRIDAKILEECKDGLIVTSACLGGQISFNILKGNLEKAENYVKEYKRIFGDDFYIELQLHPVDEQKMVNKQNILFAKKYNIPMVITQDVHYVDQEDVELHELVIRLKGKDFKKEKKEDGEEDANELIRKEVKSTINPRLAMIKEQTMKSAMQTEKEAGDSDGYFYNAREYYFKSFQEMHSAWASHHQYLSEEDFNAAMLNTIAISDKIEKINPTSKVAYLPKVVTDGTTAKAKFKAIVIEGAKNKLTKKIKGNPELKEKYEKRLREELDTIFDLGFEDYFLIVWDFINWARKNNIAVGPGRGSVGGSLVAYCADITKIDPIEHGLLFSRFINKTRSSAKYKIDFDGMELEKKK